MFVNFTTTVPISFVEPFQGLNVQLYRDIDSAKREKALICYDTNIYRSTFILMGRKIVNLNALPPNKIRELKEQGAVINNKNEVEIQIPIPGCENLITKIAA
jgi:hypothetical protein